MKSVTTKFLAVAALAVGFAAPSFADFSGPYDLANWTQTPADPVPGGSTTTGGPAVLTFNGGDDGCFSGDCNVRFSVPVAGDGNITFDWAYETDDLPAFELFGYAVNGVPVQLSDNSGGSPQSGSGSVPVLLGDTFEFYYDCTDCGFGPGTASVENFNGPGRVAVPEPVSLALLGIGLLGLGASRLRVRRS